MPVAKPTLGPSIAGVESPHVELRAAHDHPDQDKVSPATEGHVSTQCPVGLYCQSNEMRQMDIFRSEAMVNLGLPYW